MIDLAPHETIIDSFAGGGGASAGLKLALGRSPDVAINHDPEAVALHAANHPETLHLCQSVWKANPEDVAAAAARHRGIDPKKARVGVAWFSPDCKHFSKAKGGAPVEKKIRDLAWVVVHYARQVRPRIIMLENVEEFRDWGPLILTEDGKTKPCPVRKGFTFKKWVRELRKLGYAVEHRELRACDYGTPTIRKRLFVVARCDGKAIVWPKPTHAKDSAGGLLPWRTAAECIDWMLPTPSIFLTREEGRKVGCNRPLAPATMARIARGVKRYVLDASKPFIVPITHTGDRRVYDIADPLRTVTTANGGEQSLVVPSFAGVGGRAGQSRPRGGDEPMATMTAKADTVLVAAHVTKFRTGATGHAMDEPLATVTANSHTETGREGGAPPLGIAAASLVQMGYGEREGQAPRALDLQQPLGTVTAGGVKHAAVAAFLAQHNTDMVGHDARKPLSTIVGKGCTQAVVAASISDLYGTSKDGKPVDAPLGTVTAQGTHAALVSAFLDKYYGNEGAAEPGSPMHTVTTKDRFGLVTVDIDGQTYAVVDIGMRMLTPRELYRAQGFDDSYRIEIEHEGKRLSKAAQIRMCGNSVCPPLAAALARAQLTTAQPERSAA